MDQIKITTIPNGFQASTPFSTGQASTPDRALLLAMMAGGLIDNQITKRIPTEQETLTTPGLLDRMIAIARANDSLEEDLPAPQLNDLLPALDEQLMLFANEYPQFELDWATVVDIKSLILRAQG